MGSLGAAGVSLSEEIVALGEGAAIWEGTSLAPETVRSDWAVFAGEVGELASIWLVASEGGEGGLPCSDKVETGSDARSGAGSGT